MAEIRETGPRACAGASSVVRLRSPGVWALALAMLAGCSSSSDPSGAQRSDAGPGNGAKGGRGSTGGAGFDNPDPETASSLEYETMAPIPEGCGNGDRSRAEACDDGNRTGGDGCSRDCLGVEPGYACRTPGTPCRPIARCGDGLVAPSEACDDDNTADGDGCSASCRLELGFSCSGEPSDCTPTTCGDGAREGREACDDGNTLPFDGCSRLCEAEPDCSEGACRSTCGDGLVLGEECDDGNQRDGDGCSASCTIEDGFTCTSSSDCDQQDGPCVLKVPVVYRDFNSSHPDFQVGCGELTTGLVQARLSPAGKPVLVNPGAGCIQSPDTFSQWYTDGPERGTIGDELTLFDNGDGGFVNRFGEDGERFEGPDTGNGMPVLYDGNPLFFPIDDAADALDDSRHPAKLPEEYGFNGWPDESSVYPNAPLHNFHFTTEVVHWFTYEADTEADLLFTGDDDVWVFVNGHLALDLGGPHVPLDGEVQVGAATAAQYELEPGNVYEIRVFHAERKREGSTFRLTLTGFNTAPSECTPICGDGIVTAGEQCDEGDNPGGYEACEADCKLGPHCGDGLLQDGEDCDDGNRRDGDGCGSSCRELILE